MRAPECLPRLCERIVKVKRKLVIELFPRGFDPQRKIVEFDRLKSALIAEEEEEEKAKKMETNGEKVKRESSSAAERIV